MMIGWKPVYVAKIKGVSRIAGSIVKINELE
jgi:hypothetical protein